LIKNVIVKYIEPIDLYFKHGLAFKVSNVLCELPFIMLFTYLPPCGSTSYDNEEPNGIVHLETFVSNIRANYGNNELLISGDMNARTKDEYDFILDDSPLYLPMPDYYVCDDFASPRNSRDLHGELNTHGTSLLNFCCSNDVHFLNGRINGDEEGHLTCFTSNGCSVVDYTLASSSLFPFFCKFQIGEYDDFTHLPQTMILSCNQLPIVTEDYCQNECKSRITYCMSDDALNRMLESEYFNMLTDKIQEGNIDDALECFGKLVEDSCIKKNKKKRKPKIQNEWWDDEMKDLKSRKLRCLRLLRKVSCEQNLIAYRSLKRLYKDKIRQKKEQVKIANKKKVENCRSASDFWKFLKSKSDKKNCANKITCLEWKTYFEGLLKFRNIEDDDFDNSVKEFMSVHDQQCNLCKNYNGDALDDLNCNISIAEVEHAISELKTGKSAGLDGITNEILKKSSIHIVPILCSLFNRILELSYFPSIWSQALIVPVYKQGEVKNPKNFRGISLLSCVGKLFTKLLNKRLYDWAEQNDLLFDSQAGFRKGKSTIDHIFVLQGLVSKYLSKKGGRFYGVYVDFRTAFDSVPHLQLFYSLIQENIHGRVLNVLRNMYSKLESCVEASDGSISEVFPCEIGTRQGCMISPILFVLYLNEFIKQINRENCNGIFIDEEYNNVNMLLYADDIVLVGDNIGHVQKLLDNLSLFSRKWGLKVNMDKTKLMVFRNGGIIKGVEKVYYNGERIKAVSYYKYLGLIMSTRLSWSPAQKTLSQQSEKCMNFIKTINHECDFSFTTSNEIFNKCIIPIITYGGEVWGPYVSNVTESVLVKFCRNQLGVSSMSPVPAVLGECGRHSLYVKCYMKCVKYWTKLISLTNNSLLKSCYIMLFNLCNAGRQNWASEVKNILYRYGFGYIWEAQRVENVESFMYEFEQRVNDCDLQKWNECIGNMPKLRTYKLFKTNLNPEPYLTLSIPYKIRKAIAKFRISNSKLEIEIGRHTNVELENRLCKLCLNVNSYHIEDEYHVIMICPFYQELRNIYLSNDYPCNMFSFLSIMSTTEERDLTKLGCYITNAFQLRNVLLTTL
jgi:hypothetical protein